jgi:hypothetical protein
MAEIKSESVADFIPESAADFARNMQAAVGFAAQRTDRVEYAHDRPIIVTAEIATSFRLIGGTHAVP